MVDFNSFVERYPMYLNLPYSELDIAGKVEEALVVYPGIVDCLPENARLLALKYALEDLICQEESDGSFGVVEEQKSRNDTVKYSLAAKGNVMVNRLWAKRLQGLFLSYGCYHQFGKVGNCPKGSCGC
jgi:hypothetical protein